MSTADPSAASPSPGREKVYAPVPGPADRESFFAAAARNRRASWRLTALSTLAILILGIPLSTVVAPLLYGAFFLGADAMNLITPTPDALGSAMRKYDEADQRAARAPGATPGVSDPSREQIVSAVLVGAAILVPPGALFLLLAWLGVRALFLRHGVGGVLLSLGAREPRTGDLEERQLVNLVAEMAIAAGVPPLRVMLLDTPAVNAAAVGSSLQDGVVIVSRGLLDALDRDETQGVIGHLIGSVGNGDLRLAMTVLSVFQTVGVVAAALSSPFGPQARATLWRLVRFAFGRRSREAGAEAEAVTRLLADTLDAETLEIEDFEKQGWLGKVKSVAMLPFLTAYMAFWMNQRILGMILVGPPLSLAWRARRYLADATAVQLTRNPDGLARALLRLAGAEAAVPGAGWASHLFVTWPRKIGDRETFAAKVGIVGSLHPAPERRLERLRAMGSTVPPPAAPGSGRLGLKVAGALLFSPLILLLLAMMLAVAGGVVMISLAIDGLFLFGLFVVPLHALLRHFGR